MANKKQKFAKTSATSHPDEISDTEAYQKALDEGTMAKLPEPNIIFVGRDAKGEIREAPDWRRDGPNEFYLPDSETQAAGFYHELADDLIRAWPADFKRPVKKGAKK